MDRKEYLENYRKYHYSKTRKIITFPLLLGDFQVLQDKATLSDTSTNTMAKQIILSFLENSPSQFMSIEQKTFLQEYIRISRGIANNINQMAHASNIGEAIDIRVLISSLKHYEDGFKDLLVKLNQNDK